LLLRHAELEPFALDCLTNRFSRIGVGCSHAPIFSGLTGLEHSL
jgi:hypothetical protein